MSKSPKSIRNDLFNWPVRGNSTEVKEEMISLMADKLGLDFITWGSHHEDNLCYFQSADLRDEFKTVFTALDVADYAQAMVHSSGCRTHLARHPETDVLPVPYPINSAIFWKLVRLGRRLRKECTSESGMDHLMLEIDAVIRMERPL